MKVLLTLALLLNISDGVSVELVDERGGDTQSLTTPTTLRGTTSRLAIETITALRLVDANTKLPIRTLMNDDVINLATLQSRALTIDAITSSIQNISSVRFDWNDVPNFRTEKVAPYTLCGNTNTKYFACTYLTIIGKYTITATPVSTDGVSGNSQTVTFDIIDVSPVGGKAKACSVPKLLDSTWSDFLPKYPVDVKETQGVMIGNDIIISSGFIDGFTDCTNQTYARDVTGNKGNEWRRMDDLPLLSGISHGAATVVGTKMYVCGGFYGGNPGLHVPDCYVYDHSKLPGKKQWSKISSLPDGGTGGGGIVYDTATNSLYYAAGGIRDRVAPTREIYDVNAFYKYDFSNPKAGWTDMGLAPYNANHISAVTAFDKFGKEHHYFLGGQIGKDECRSNLSNLYEWNAVTKKWTTRANIPFPRGHAPSSTVPIGCGFVMAGGSVNTPTGCYKKTSDISYYDIDTNTWASIGNLTIPFNAPVCAIGNDGYFYHISSDSNRRRISV